MSTVAFDRNAVAAAIRNVGSIDDAGTFLQAHGGVAQASAPLPIGAVELLTQSGVDHRLAEADKIDAARTAIAYETTVSLERALSNSISTQQASKLLGTQDSNIRRAIAQRRIYSASRDSRHGHRLPIWQLIGDKTLPHLAEVLGILPTDLHPLEVESFFTTPQTRLDGASPALWLATGGAVAPIIELADDESRH